MYYYFVSFNYPDDEYELEEYFNNAEALRKLEPLPEMIKSDGEVVRWLKENCKNGVLPYQFSINQYSEEIDPDIGGHTYYGCMSGEEFLEATV